MVGLPTRYPLDPPRRPIPSGSSHVARDGAKSNTAGDLGPAGAARRGGPRDAGACGARWVRRGPRALAGPVARHDSVLPWRSCLVGLLPSIRAWRRLRCRLATAPPLPADAVEVDPREAAPWTP